MALLLGTNKNWSWNGPYQKKRISPAACVIFAVVWRASLAGPERPCCLLPAFVRTFSITSWLLCVKQHKGELLVCTTALVTLP